MTRYRIRSRIRHKSDVIPQRSHHDEGADRNNEECLLVSSRGSRTSNASTILVNHSPEGRPILVFFASKLEVFS